MSNSTASPRPRSMGAAETNSSHECPTCQETFPTDRGKKIHHARVHGESLADHYEWVCAVCGEHCSRLESEIDDDYPPKYCDEDCRRVGTEEAAGVDLVCEECGETFSVPPSKADGRRFCNRGCYRDVVTTSPQPTAGDGQ